MSDQTPELHFGECPYCDRAIERPFWDTCCFTCQDENYDEDAERDEQTSVIFLGIYTVPMQR